MPLRPLAAPALFLAFCCGLACTSSSPATTTPDAGTGPQTCSSDAECDKGFKCDREQRRCVCTGDEACPTGKFCNAFSGVCVDTVGGCTSDGVCKPGEYCERALRTCKPVTGLCGACKTDAQCGSGARCAAHPDYPGAGTFCSPLCAQPGGTCPATLTCRARDASAGAEKLCFPQQGACGLTNACTPDALSLCASNTDCTDATQQCDTTLKACVAKNRVCPAGDACDPQQRVCVHACSIDSDCTAIEGGPGYKCRNNACFKLTTCTADADCPTKQICAPNPDGSKSCRAGCTQATDCPLGQGCNNDPSHPRCASGCTQNTDCALNTICDQGACKSTFGSCAQACQNTAACPIGSVCSAQFCCVAQDLAQLCPNTKKTPNCVTNDYYVYLSTCASNAQCDAAYGAGATTCQPASGANYCRTSLTLKACTGAADCPAKGFRCRDFACGGSKVCFPEETPAAQACVMGHP